MVRTLWLVLNSSSELTDGSGHDAILNGTGDGALVSFPRISNPQVNGGRIIGWRETVEFARKWVARLADNGIDLRVGIHQGEFQVVNVAELGGHAKHGGRQVVGRGPNTCARVVGLGDAGDIVVSEDFVQAWREDVAVDNLLLDPALDDNPFEALVKHGRVLKVRVVRRDGRVPRRLARSAVVADQLMAALRKIEDDLLHMLGYNHTPNDRKQLSTRISIWVPDRAVRALEATEFRYHCRGEHVAPGSTRYSLDGDGNGPPARAFRSNDVVVITRLPNYDLPRSRKAYHRRMSDESGLDEQTVAHFSRHARSFIEIPFGLTSDRPDGVICIDCTDPLARHAKRQICGFAQRLREYHGVTVAALWQLRLS